MRKSLSVVLALAFGLAMATGASAHIGDKIFLLFEISDADLADIDLRDGSVEDWEDVVGDPNLLPSDFFADPTVGAGAQYDPADMDYRIWLNWNDTGNHLYMATERIDDIYINEYAGGNLSSLWQHDAVEFMVDGDHNGGDISSSANPDWTDEEKILNNNRTGQQFVAIADSPDGRKGGYLGAGSEWVNAPPFGDAGGNSTGDGPTVSIIEFYVTPFDDLIWNSPDDSRASSLDPGVIIGFSISMQDFDTAPTEYKAFHTITGQASTWRYNERLGDGRLIAAGGGGTAVENDSWGNIKASFAE